MKITVIGAGNAFSEENFNQSFLVQEGDRTMLIDCGYQVPGALRVAGIDYRDIQDIYISHLHADHIGGLEFFAFQRYDWANKPRKAGNGSPTIIGNTQLLTELWDKSLRGGLESMEGFVAGLDTFFHVQPIEPNQSFEWQGWTVELIQQIHIMSGSIIMPSFGILFSRTGRKSVYFVTDSQHCSPRQIEDFYGRADIIFQDAEFVGVDVRMKEGEKYLEKDGEMIPKESLDADNLLFKLADGWEEKQWSRFRFGSGVHASYAQLAGYPSANSIRLSDEIKGKMWLSHYQDFVLHGRDMFGNEVDWDAIIAEDGFAGRVERGMTFEI
jgi:hypothetical protein